MLLVLTELQPLHDKTKGSIATALKNIMESVLQNLSLNNNPLVLHIMVGDAIATNAAAGKMLIDYMVRTAKDRFQYAAVILKCGSHQANLAAAASLSGNSSEIVAACSRLHKFVLPDYFEEIRQNLWTHIWQHFEVRDHDDQDDQHAEHWRRMDDLYGLFGPDLLQCLNGAPTMKITSTRASYSGFGFIFH